MQNRRSKKRERIFEILYSTKSHPTAEQIYQELKKDFPDVGLATVYRNLKILLEEKKIFIVDVGDGREHYDADLSEHAHCFCIKCKRVFDIADVSINNANLPDGFVPTGQRYYVYGVCKNCQNEQ